MDIQWHGLSCVTLKGKTGIVLIDPYDRPASGIKPPKLTPDVVLANSDFELHHAVEDWGKEAVVFDWPGEYESRKIIIQGISAYDRPREKEEGRKDESERIIIFTVEIDGFRVCHLSNLGHKLTPAMLEAIGDVDILFVPVGGAGCLDAEKAHEVIEQLDPRIVIPMYYKVPGVKLPLAELDVFLKEVGLHAPPREKVLKFQTPANLPQEHTEFRILEPALG